MRPRLRVRPEDRWPRWQRKACPVGICGVEILGGPDSKGATMQGASSPREWRGSQRPSLPRSCRAFPPRSCCSAPPGSCGSPWPDRQLPHWGARALPAPRDPRTGPRGHWASEQIPCTTKNPCLWHPHPSRARGARNKKWGAGCVRVGETLTALAPGLGCCYGEAESADRSAGPTGTWPGPPSHRHEPRIKPHRQLFNRAAPTGEQATIPGATPSTHPGVPLRRDLQGLTRGASSLRPVSTSDGTPMGSRGLSSRRGEQGPTGPSHQGHSEASHALNPEGSAQCPCRPPGGSRGSQAPTPPPKRNAQWGAGGLGGLRVAHGS